MNSYSLCLFSQKPTPPRYDPVAERQLLPPRIHVACLERLKGEGQSILVVDKNVDALEKLADAHVVVEKGQVVWSGTSAELAADPTIRERYLSV